jgi:hypothetical protein
MEEPLSLRSVKDAASLPGEKAATVKEQLEDFGQAAGRKLQGAQRQTAGALHGAVSSDGAADHESPKAIDEFGDKAAVRLESSSTYARRFGAWEMVADLRRLSAAILAGQ